MLYVCACGGGFDGEFYAALVFDFYCVIFEFKDVFVL